MKSLTNNWQLIDWDGNTELHYKCYRKRFGRGHVSVGVGEFLHVVFSYGPDSDNSMSASRWNYDEIISEQDYMNHIDNNNGHHSPYRLLPGQYREWFNHLDSLTQDAIRAVGQPWHSLIERRHQQKMLI